MKALNLFIPITKVDEAKRLAYGIATAELPDQSGEVCDYETTKPYYKEWSAQFEKASGGKSLGNVRAMHGNVAAGKVTQIVFNDSMKQIEVCTKIIDDAEWKKVAEGVYTGFSQGGSYVKTWKDGDYIKYTAKPSEISLVDNPCLLAATFTLIRANGATEMRKFQTKEETMKKKLAQVWQAADGTTFEKKEDAVKKNIDLEAAAIADPGKAAAKEIDELLTKAEGKGDAEDKDGGADTGGEKDPKKDDDKNDPANALVTKKATGKIKKGMFEVARLADLISELGWLQGCCENEAMWEMDGSKIPADLMDAVRALGDVLKDMVEEEVNELIGAESATLAMAVKLNTLAKKGAEISGKNKTHIEKMMKSATGHMEQMQECYKGMGLGDADDADDVKKSVADDAEKQALIAQVAELQKDKELAEAKNTAFEKQLKEQADDMAKFAARLKNLEAQPLPAKGSVYQVNKGHGVTQVAAGSDPKAEPVEVDYVKKMSNMSPAQAARIFNHG